ncbi:MAG: histidinol-phosphatase [candidate division WOR-3 bacterium]|nr:histidinol-phosphatase [candidate division WOR-3 bacterium]
MIDYHIHTHHSIDAEGSPDEYCKQALKLGLKEICFTNHCELDPLRDDNLIRINGEIKPLSQSLLFQLQNEVFKLKEQYAKKGLNIKFGLEVGFFSGIEKRLKEIADGLEIDYLLAGIHCLEHICIDSSKECNRYFQNHTAEKLLEDYFNNIQLLIRSGLFDAVAHFDVYKKYGLNFYGEKVRLFNQEWVYQIFKLMIQNEVGLEINTAGLRRHNEFHPSAEFMKLAKDAGIKIITIGSDAHRIEDLGKGVKEAIEYARSYGFERAYMFFKRHKFPLDIR